MSSVKDFMIERGMQESNADYLDSLIHPNFIESFVRGVNFKSEEEKEWLIFFERFLDQHKKGYTIYQGKKTTYLINDLWFDELLAEVEKVDSDEEYQAFYSPVIVDKMSGEIVFD